MISSSSIIGFLMSSIIIIPARLDSTRLPQKPLADVAGKPLIIRVYEQAKITGVRVVVACDSEKIATLIKKAGGEAVLTDPALPSGSDRIWAALKEIDPLGHYKFIVNMQGDLPTLSPKLIEEGLEVLWEGKTDIVTMASPIEDAEEIKDPNVVKAVFDPATGIATNFTRSSEKSQDGNYYHHIGIYLYKRDALKRFVSLPPSPREKEERLEQLRALDDGMTIGVIQTDEVPLGVDTPKDLEQAREHYSE